MLETFRPRGVTRRRLRRSALVAGAVVFSAALVSCSSGAPAEDESTSGDTGWDAIVEAANAEGEVVLYTSRQPAFVDQIREAFNEDYPGITVEYFHDVGGVLQERVAGERDAGAATADVAEWANPLWMQNEEAEGRTAAFEGPDIAAAGESCYLGDSIVVTSSDPLAIAYNTDEISDPESLEDFVSPDYKALLIEPASAPVPWMYTTYGWDWLEEVSAEGNFTLGSSGPAAMQSIAAGEVAWAPNMNTAPIKALADSGAPVAAFIPDKVPVIDFAAVALTAAEHPNAAQVYVNWLMSPRGQEVLTADEKGASCMPDVTGDIELVSPERMSPEVLTPEYVEEGKARFYSLFQK